MCLYSPSPPCRITALYGPYTGGSLVGTICASARGTIKEKSNGKDKEQRDNISIARMNPLEAVVPPLVSAATAATDVEYRFCKSKSYRRVPSSALPRSNAMALSYQLIVTSYQSPASIGSQM